MKLADRISKFNRGRKWKIFTKEFPFDKNTSILDVGFNNIEYSEIDNYLEKVYPYLENITALGVEEANEFKERYPLVKAVLYDGDHFPFPEKSFDIVWSNAVIEHVGSREKQLLFLKEIKKAGKSAFVTTPNRYFPVEIHTRTVLLHFLPKNIFYNYLHKVGKSWATGNYMNLLTKRMIVQLLKDAGIQNYKIRRNRFFFFTLDFVIIIR